MTTPSELAAIVKDITEILIPVIVREFRHQRRVSAKPDGLMTLSQAADYLGISPKTLARDKKQGRVKVHTYIGKRARFVRADLDRAYPGPGM